jgi:tetratricopeptide (TPR) repeat protein
LDPNYSPAYNNLGLAYKQKDDYDKAIEYYQKALKLDFEQVGPGHTEVAIRYNNLGIAYEYKGEYDKAIEYYQKALKMGFEQLGPEHPKIAIRFNNLGAAYGRKGRARASQNRH